MGGWLWLVVGWLVWVAGGYMKCTLGMVGLVSIALAMAADADAANAERARVSRARQTQLQGGLDY